ncbi:MAG: transcriptional regulator [Saprospiraceae bacterium]|nr:transcriptional regulator [Saprospiraceae bacterium]MBK7360418.1 transcriptional regulator [Saprospiraceae bacterium]MBK7736455.1 transcriptional regulator [Saprospiraceae bacterium]MBK7912180.1 transcriptional regulator [Saprospiraceae bacterium]
MKELIYGLNREFESRIRLGIMSILMVNDKVEFKSLKELLELTDGNLASHLSALEKAGYLKVKKQFIDRKPNTSYSATSEGKKAFNAHLKLLEKFLKKQ